MEYTTEMWNTTEEYELKGDLDEEKRKTFARIGGLILLALCLFGIFGNVLTLAAVGMSKKLRPKKSTWLVASLSVSDLIFCIALLLTVGLQWRYKEKALENQTFCSVTTFLLCGGVLISIASLLLITLNRFVVIVIGKWYRRFYKTRSTIIQILVVWLYYIGLLFLPAFKVWGEYRYDNVTKFCTISGEDDASGIKLLFLIQSCIIPVGLMIMCYILIFKQVRRSRQMVESFGLRNDDPSIKKNERLSASEVKLAKTMMATFIVFLISYSPFTIAAAYGLDNINMGVRFLCLVLACSAATTNFIIYAVYNPQYREAYKQLFHGIAKVPRQLSLSNTASTRT